MSNPRPVINSRRRDLLRIGSLAPFGLSMTSLFAAERSTGHTGSPTAKSCILLWLDGGPSHLETFDLKPDAPAEVRGPFNPIPTNVPGIQISELLPLTANICDKICILRSLTSPLGEHGLANQYLMTGYKPTPVIQYPSIGSVMTHVRPYEGVLPPYVVVPEARHAGAGFLGPAHEPFVTGGDPASAEFRVKDLDFFPGVDVDRLQRRKDYLAAFDTTQSKFEQLEAASDPAFDRAYRLVTSGDTKQAFALDHEPESVRARYGPRTFGQSCLLARRLVERGVPFVTVFNSGWDTHEELVRQLRDGYTGAKVGVGLIPTFDQAFSALIGDLSERGLLDQTLVVVMGEFGRTPKINTRGGRDHWPRVFSAVVAGGGVAGGQVVGASDRMGESPRDVPVSPSDLVRSVYLRLGVNPDQELRTSDGRPVVINQGGVAIPALVGTIG